MGRTRVCSQLRNTVLLLAALSSSARIGGGGERIHASAPAPRAQEGGRRVTIRFPRLPPETKVVQLVLSRNCGEVSVAHSDREAAGSAVLQRFHRPRHVTEEVAAEASGDGRDSDEGRDVGLITLRLERAPGGQAQVELEYTGELLEIREWFPGRRYTLSEWLSTAREEEESYWTWRRERAEAGPYRKEKEFFNNLDYGKPLSTTSSDLLGVLKQRLEARQADPHPTSSISEDLKTILSFESGGLKDMLRGAFHEDGISDVELQRRVANALDRFGSGELSLLESEGDEDAEHRRACQPNSPYFYLFAEFADLCVESRVDEEFWEPLLRPFVHALDGFLESYVTTTDFLSDSQDKRGAHGGLCGFLYVRRLHPERVDRSEEQLDAARERFIQDNPDEQTFRSTWQELAKRIDFGCDVDSEILLASLETGDHR